MTHLHFANSKLQSQTLGIEPAKVGIGKNPALGHGVASVTVNMQTLKNVVNVSLSLFLIAFILLNLGRLAMYVMHQAQIL